VLKSRTEKREKFVCNAMFNLYKTKKRKKKELCELEIKRNRERNRKKG